VGTFGEKLRKQREQRGLDLDAISKTTKISTRMLRAIEDEHFDQLPGGVFNKGFVRAYARQIGLDEDEAVADYLTALRESQQPSVPADVRFAVPKPSAAAAREPGEVALADDADTSKDTSNKDGGLKYDPRSPDRRKHGRPSEDRRHQDRRSADRRNEERRSEARRHPNKFQKYPAGDPAERADESSAPIPWGKLALTLVLITLVLALWNFRRQAPPAPAPQPVPFSNQSPAPASAPAPAATQPSTAASSLTAGPASPAGNAPPEKSSPSIPATTTPPHSEPASSTPAAQAADTNSATKLAAEPDANPPAAKAIAPAAAEKPPTTFTLLIRADKTTWVSLVADGKPVAHETLIAPAHISARATHEIVVKTGNAAGISFLLNGKEIPAQGNEGEVKTYTFNATGLQTQ
jgi:cytoskeletal protein RodZ